MNNAKKNIVIICSRLDVPGGIERAICNTANLFSEQAHKVSLLIIDEVEGIFYSVRKDISIWYAKLHFGITEKGNTLTRKIAMYKHVQLLKKILLQLNADIIISTDYVFSVALQLCKKSLKAKTFAWEHRHFGMLQKNPFWRYMSYRAYPKLDAVICLNKKEAVYFKSIGCTTFVIPNFITAQTKAPLDSKTLLTIGWLTKTKGVDLIPEIASIVFKKHADWKWKIIGVGEEKEALKINIQNKNLNSFIEIIPPVSHNLDVVYQSATLYVMTSRFECFPMVLLEAMSFGVPCVAFDCLTGPAEIIQNNIDGLLTEKENTTAIAEAIISLIEDEEKRVHFGANAYKNIQRFSPENVYALWRNLLEQTK